MLNLNTNSPATFSRINSDKTIDLDTDKSSPTTPTEATTKTVILGASKTEEINQKKPGAVSTFFHALFSGNFSGAMAVFSHTLHNISSQIHLKFLLATKPTPNKLLEQFKNDDATGKRPSAEKQLEILAQAWPILKLQTELKKGDGPFLEDFLAEYSGMPNGNLAIHNHQIPESIREFLVNFGSDFLHQHSIFNDVKNGNWIGLFKTADRDTLSQLLKLEKFPEFFGDLPSLKEFLEETIRKDENTMIEADREFPRFLTSKEAGFANEIVEGMIMNMTPDELFPKTFNEKEKPFLNMLIKFSGNRTIQNAILKKTLFGKEAANIDLENIRKQNLDTDGANQLVRVLLQKNGETSSLENLLLCIESLQGNETGMDLLIKTLTAEGERKVDKKMVEKPIFLTSIKNKFWNNGNHQALSDLLDMLNLMQGSNDMQKVFAEDILGLKDHLPSCFDSSRINNPQISVPPDADDIFIANAFSEAEKTAIAAFQNDVLKGIDTLKGNPDLQAEFLDLALPRDKETLRKLFEDGSLDCEFKQSLQNSEITEGNSALKEIMASVDEVLIKDSRIQNRPSKLRNKDPKSENSVVKKGEEMVEQSKEVFKKVVEKSKEAVKNVTKNTANKARKVFSTIKNLYHGKTSQKNKTENDEKN